ncbi:MAG: hypothetical protein WCJ37_15550 [Syntrophus sp. (in: bacteria)]
MITIYKNNDESSWSEYVLCVAFSKNIYEQIYNWQAPLDRIVFDEQMTTGSFHGSFPINDNQRLRMQELQEKGNIRPYYGATNSSALTYTLQVTPPTCIIGVEHEVVNERVSFEDTVDLIQEDESRIAGIHKQGFMVEEKEYRTLQKWKNWNAKEEFTSRYIYKFLPSSIGLGITITDAHTKEQIDISDYCSW